MQVGIQKDQYGKFCRFLERYEKILDFNSIDHIRLEASQSDFWERIRTLDLFIFRWKHYDTYRQLAHTILPVIEGEMGITCLPDWKTCWHYDDKIKEYYLLKQHRFPIIDSFIFWEGKAALEWLGKADFPLVFKLKVGAGSRNVILIKTKKQAVKHVNKMFGKGLIPRSIDRNQIKFTREIHHFGGNLLRKIKGEDVLENWQRQKNYILFQKYLPDNNYDIRITVIGDRAFAFMRFNRKDDFRASGSGKIDYSKNKMYKKCIEIAFNVSKKMDFQSMAYDFLFTPDNEPQFSEISYTYLDTAIYNCPGYWDLNLNWHEGHYWPQYFQLMDVLNLPDLKQPEMK
ncbi:hypothetical protein ES705_14025 [subsurface metagenome]